MSLSACSMCWDTPCGCGFNYLHYSQSEGLREKADLLRDIADFIDEFGSVSYPASYEIREANFNKFKAWRKEHRGR